MRKIFMTFLFTIMVLAGMCIQTETIFAEDIAVSDESDAIEKYNALLYEWAYDKNIIDDVHADFPDYYGGAYLKEGKLVIQVTELNDAVKEELSGIISLEDVVFEEVTYAYTELVAANEALAEAFRDTEKKTALGAVTEMGIDIKDNSVSVGIAAAENSEAALQVVETCNEITDFENIKYIYDSSRAKPAASMDAAPAQEDDATAAGAEERNSIIAYAVAGLLLIAAVIASGVRRYYGRH